MEKLSHNPRNFLYILKKYFILLTIVIVLPIASVVSFQYLKVVFSPSYDIDKMPLNYELLGTGDTKLVLIHGLTGSLNYWKRDIESITKTHQLLLVDLLGFGDSPKPKTNYSLDEQINALEKIIIKEEFNNGQTIILGHSMGSIISLALLAKHPGWFKGAVVVSVPIYANEEEFAKVMKENSLFNRLTVGPFAKIFCMLHPIYFMTNLFKPDNLTNDIFQDAKKHNWLSYYNSLHNLILSTDLNTYAKDLKNKKIIFIHGEEDKTAPIANAKKLSDGLNNAKLISIKDGDHQLFLKNTKLVWNAIKDF